MRNRNKVLVEELRLITHQNLNQTSLMGLTNPIVQIVATIVRSVIGTAVSVALAGDCAWLLMHAKPWSVASNLYDPVEEEAPYATDYPLSGLSRPSSVADECEPASNDEAFWYPNIDQLGNGCDKSVAYEAVSKEPMMQLLDTRRSLNMTDVR